MDTVFGRVAESLAIAYLSAFQQATPAEVIGFSDSEQERLAGSFVAFEPGAVFRYDTALDKETQVRLTRKAVDRIPFHPGALVARGGSLRRMIPRLHRETII